MCPCLGVYKVFEGPGLDFNNVSNSPGLDFTRFLRAPSDFTRFPRGWAWILIGFRGPGHVFYEVFEGPAWISASLGHVLHSGQGS
jgi:hypothetical protein